MIDAPLNHYERLLDQETADQVKAIRDHIRNLIAENEKNRELNQTVYRLLRERGIR